MPYDNLVVQSYDEASNMSRYNDLQAKFKELVGKEHIIFVHCYAHTLFLVLGNTVTVVHFWMLQNYSRTYRHFI